jgi:hypothetical protein
MAEGDDSMRGSATTRRGEQGKGALGSIVGLVVFLAILYAIFHVGPPFVTDYSFKDKLNEMARLNRGQYPDEKIMDMILKEIRDRQLDDVIQKSQVKIHTVETSRRIIVEYDQNVKILPGWERVFHFVDDVDQPLVF